MPSATDPDPSVFLDCDPNTGQRVYPSPPIAAQSTDLSTEETQFADRTPSDRRKHPSAPAEMYLKATSWPPLGRNTVVSRHQNSVRVTVLIEAAPHDIPHSVCIWHNHNGDSDWDELHLQKVHLEGVHVFPLNAEPSEGASYAWFTAELSGQPKHGQVVHFTYKFKTGDDQEWRWLKDVSGIEDAELEYQTTDWEKHSSYDIKHFFPDISEKFTVESVKPDTPNTKLYSLTCSILPCNGTDSFAETRMMGVPANQSRWFALIRLWVPWLAPRQGNSRLNLDQDGILVSFLRTDGLHVVCLAVSGVDDLVTTFASDWGGNLSIVGRNDRTEPGTAKVLVAVADSFEVANAAVMYQARKVVGPYGTPTAEGEAKTLIDTGVKPEWLEEWYDGLAYCTWNGLGQDLTAQKIYSALDDLSNNHINITNLIIDDNWQSLSDGDSQFVRGWSQFEANKDGFPEGLKGTTREIRKRHPHINHIAVWHAILGYWGGIDPNGSIAKTYKTIEVEKEPGVAGGKFTVVAAEDAKKLYNDFYAFLSSAGVDSVKTDAQFFLDLLLHSPDRRSLIMEYQDAWTIAHLKHLGSRAISCMSQTPQNLFHSQLPQAKPRLLVRNSDDFFPEVDASHPWHIFCNAHNSVLTQHLNVIPDWDMFQTSHEWASFHAAARCVSGGPIYITDEPGKHNIDLIHKMTAQTTRDKTVILRPHNTGKALDPYTPYESQALLKIGTHVGNTRAGAGIMGVFNVSHQLLTEFVGISDFPGTDEGEFVVGSYTTGNLSPPHHRAQEYPFVRIVLEPKGWDILTAYSLRKFQVRDKHISVALMGLLGKMTGAAAVSATDMYVESNGRLRIWTTLKAVGVLGLYVSDLHERTIDDGFMITLGGKPIPRKCLTTSKFSEQVLEIDVEFAFKASQDTPGFSNELNLEVFVH